MAKRIRSQPIRVTPDRPVWGGLRVGGWLQGTSTYLWFGMLVDGREQCIGTIRGGKLYRLAKAIVRHYEADRTVG